MAWKVSMGAGGLGGGSAVWQPDRQWTMAPYGQADRDRAGAMAATGSGMSQMVEAFNKAYADAKAANEQRYQQMLGIADQTTNQRAADVRQAYGQQQSDMMQQLARSGLAGTTIAPTMKMGVARERESALNRLADEMQQTKLGIIERREDMYPDRGALQSLIAGMGAQFGVPGMGLTAQSLAQMRY